MAFKLAGYHADLPNQVYSRQGKRVINFIRAGMALPLTEIILPRRFKEVSEEDVVALLQRKASELEDLASSCFNNSNRSRLTNNELEQAILCLPIRYIRYLAKGDEEFLDIIRKNVLAPRLEDERLAHQYLQVRYGLFPEPAITQKRKEGKLSNASNYDFIFLQPPSIKIFPNGLSIKDYIGQHFSAQIRYDNGFPLKDKINILVEQGVYRSNSLNVDLPDYNQEEVQDVLDTLYASNIGPESFSQLPDISGPKVEKAALQSVLLQLKKLAAKKHQNATLKSPKKPEHLN